MKQRLSTLATLALALIPTVAAADKKITDIPKPDPKAPLGSSTPVQQWRDGENGRSSYGTPVEFMLLADELGSRQSELGRARMIQHCLPHQASLADGALAWSVCRADVKAFDLAKVEKELTAEGITGADRTATLEWVKDILKTAHLTGDPIEELAKTEPGVQQILKVGDDARTEWAAYAAKNKAAIELYLALKDGVRSARGDHKAFTNCLAATQPPFAKLVKAAAPKIPYSYSTNGSDGYTPFYLSQLPHTADTYIASVSYGACLWSLHVSGAQLYDHAGSVDGGRAIAGPRMLAVSKLIDENFKPKFADRSLAFRQPDLWKVNPPVAADRQFDDALASSDGIIAKISQEGEMTKIVYRGEYFERCIQYSKDVDKTCLKRGQVYDSVGEGVVFSKFLFGAKPDFGLATKFGFPEVVWNPKTKKLLTILTIPVN